ncbi:alpha/beta hydrolase [Bacillus solimangrovi]|uniref:AB hydrolase-1 domain-containing protein n=1 Tax=Bacillus solimangrovi TaxID=1305675 RepID=A0A1E5LIG7_9BACI|nr:alpha/beta hydrolase [Bacillus solimangrovi]OEH93848.1 hypothetical protein BFG57_11040 [Bacillus solimangrovi]
MITNYIELKNSVKIHVRYTNKLEETILFLHFSSGNSHMWDSIIPNFENRYNVIVPELRGHGQSDCPPTGYHIDDMANDMYLLLEELQVDNCHIVGSSLGAEVALSLAASHPTLVKSIICEGALYNEFGEYGLFNGSEEEITEIRNKLRSELMEFKRPIFNTKLEFIDNMKKQLQEENIWTEHFINFVEHNMMQTEDDHYTNCFPLHARQEYIQHYWDFKFETYYQKIKCPILFVLSDEEWNNPKIRKIVDRFSSFVENSEITHIQGAKHAYVWMQFPKVMSNHIYDFLNT